MVGVQSWHASALCHFYTKKPSEAPNAPCEQSLPSSHHPCCTSAPHIWSFFLSPNSTAPIWATARAPQRWSCVRGLSEPLLIGAGGTSLMHRLTVWDTDNPQKMATPKSNYLGLESRICITVAVWSISKGISLTPLDARYGAHWFNTPVTCRHSHLKADSRKRKRAPIHTHFWNGNTAGNYSIYLLQLGHWLWSIHTPKFTTPRSLALMGRINKGVFIFRE